MATYTFKSNYFLRLLKGDTHPFTPNLVTITPSTIELKRRNWYLISADTESLHFENITGISVDNHLFGATITVKSTGNDPITIFGFWKKTAHEIKEVCTQFITQQKQGVFSKPGFSPSTGTKSISEELIQLQELTHQGVITQEEFELLKKKLLNS